MTRSVTARLAAARRRNRLLVLLLAAVTEQRRWLAERLRVAETQVADQRRTLGRWGRPKRQPVAGTKQTQVEIKL